MRQRYQGYKIPPLIWHTTIARYDGEQLPLQVRKLYQTYQDHRIEALDLGSPRVMAASFDWSIAKPLSELSR